MKNDRIIPQTLRISTLDYFAGQALNALIQKVDYEMDDDTESQITKSAYVFAHEMLRSRSEAIEFLNECGYTYEKLDPYS